MRIANLQGRLAILTEAVAIDVESASGGKFEADPPAVYAQWDAFTAWAAGPLDLGTGRPYSLTELRAPSPRPSQVFAVALNYAPHADESGYERPDCPLVFTKFPSCLTGATADVPLPGNTVDWEVELVVVMSRPTYRVSAPEAWGYVAGLTIGQDFSEREVQTQGPVPQFSLGKSFPGFGPTGPCLVTPDELADPNDLAIACLIDEEVVQSGRTSQMIFSVAELIAYISSICPLAPGDLIFTGTPEGTGSGREPARFLRPGERVISRVEGLGQMSNMCVPDVGNSNVV